MTISRMVRRRAMLLTLAAAAWGLGAGIAIATLSIGEPHAGQLPGAMLARGFDGRGPLRAVLSVMIAPLVAAFALHPLALRASRETGAQTWAMRAMAIALATGVWLALVEPFDAVSIVFIPIIGASAFFLLRRVEARFTTRDVILVPSAIALYVTIAALFPPLPLTIAIVLSAAVILALRLVVRDSDAFALAPLAMLLHVRMWIPDTTATRVTALLVIALSPLAGQASARLPGLKAGLRRAAYALFAIALIASTDLAGVEGMPRLNLFEDGHSLMPADAMVHGARPYRDIVPGHGLISDGLLDFAAMKLGASDAGAVLRVRAIFAALLPAAVYCLALAVTGSSEAAILALLVAASLTLTGTPWVVPVSTLEAMPPLRAVPSLFALAACVAAVRLRSRRMLMLGGALAVIAALTSLEFGFYALVALAFATYAARDVRAGATGLAIAAIPIAVIMLVAGSLAAFIRTTLFEILPLGEVYSVAFFQFPSAHDRLRALPEILGGLFNERTVWIAAWGLVAIGTSVALALRARSRRITPLIVCGVWVTAAAMSYAERTNVYFMPVVVVIGVALIHATRRRAALFAALAIGVAVIAAPTSFLMRNGTLRRQHGLRASLARYDALPRTHGVWLDPDNAQKLAVTQAFVSVALKPGETFLDFANMPILYYLFDLRAPLRQYETPFYESETLQREVIERLERDRGVRAAIMQFPNKGDHWIDGVPNAVRAPLVFAWLQAHFVPAYERDGVVIWMRRN